MHMVICWAFHADVAHLVELHLAKVEVASSSLVIRSKQPVIWRAIIFGTIAKR